MGFGVALVAAATAAWGQGAPALVRDIHASGSSSPASVATLGDAALFAASDGLLGRELWRTDGTAAGTTLVADIRAGTTGSSPTSLTTIGSRVVFFATDPAGQGLWSTDGTAAGTQRLAASSGETLSQMRFLTAAGAQAYFTATTSRGNDLWVTDGTTAGTRIVRDLSVTFETLVAAPGRLYMFPRPSDSGGSVTVWTTDGTSAGTVQVGSLGVLTPLLSQQIAVATLGGRLLLLRVPRFSGAFGLPHTEFDLWVMEVGSAPVRIAHGASEANPVPALVATASSAYFTFSAASAGVELWKTDGTEAGLALVRDINAGAGHSTPARLVADGERLYFEADDGIHGRELWTSDGTTAGTQLVADIRPAGDGSPLLGFARPWQGALLFDADDGSGRTLWITDGTGTGTRRLGAPPAAFDPTSPAIAGARVVFAATSSATGTELWTLSCGDGVLDADEVCDDGNLATDDCCSPLCGPVGVGAPCPGLACSDGHCGAGGTCVQSPHPAGAECRAATGVCDAAEECDGTSPTCPADARLVGTICRAAAGDCDAAELCDGVAPGCPVDVKRTDVCRPAAGDCDVAESCDGVSDACPFDAVASGGTCRAAGGPCDVAESCDGASPACPSDGFQVGALCRPSAGDCDVAELCSGASGDCPPDALQPSTHVCRPGDGVCDPSESCTGADAQCPADVVELDGDADTICDVLDNCPEASNADQTDGDADGDGDACDVCTGGAIVARPSLMLTKLLAPTGDDGLKLVGRMVVSGTPAFDPLANGVRLLVTDATDAVVVDAPIPGGAYSAVTKVGWTVNAAATTWRYKHAGTSATVVGGIEAVIVKRTIANPTTIKFTVKGGVGSYPGAVAALPLRAMLVVEGPLGVHGQCGEAVFAGPTATCQALSGGKTVRCR